MLLLPLVATHWPAVHTIYVGSVAKASVYVAAAARGRGVGLKLKHAPVNASEINGLWTLQAGIFPANAASVRLHVAVGFRQMGRRERVGQLRGVWHDALLLERRSAVVGPTNTVST